MPLKLTVTKKDFARGISVAGKAVTGKTTLPILNNILISIEGLCIRLVGTDLHLGIATTVPCILQEKGSIAVPAKPVIEWLSNVPDDAEINLTELKDGQFQLKFGKSTHKFHCLPGEDYPLLPVIEDAVEFVVSERVLKYMIESVLFAVSDNVATPTFMGALMHSTPEKVIFVGTDTHRIAVNQFAADADVEESKSIIPETAMLEVLRLLSDKEDPVKVSVADKTVRFEFSGTEGIELVTSLIDGEYPAYMRVVPAEDKLDKHALVRTDVLTQAIKRLMISARENANRTVFEFSDNTLKMTAESQMIGSGEEIVECEYQGEDGFTTAFNATYILDFLKVVTSNNVKIGMSLPLKATLITPDDDSSNLLYVAVPMAIVGGG